MLPPTPEPTTMTSGSLLANSLPFRRPCSTDADDSASGNARLSCVIFPLACAAMIIAALALAAAIQQPRPEETEQWTPVPPLVKPGPVVFAAPPSDAIVLLGAGTG